MNLRFRTWWRPARKASDPHDERTVSFLELFYDLVYVVLVAQLAHALTAHLDLKHIGQFVFLFAIVWWSWLNGSWYHEFHGNNDIRTRIFTFLQMFMVAGMAVFAHNALGEGSVQFAFFFGLYQLILSYLWWRLAAHDPIHHIENRPYVIAFTISTFLFFASILVPIPLRFYLWVLAVMISLLQPLIFALLQPKLSRPGPLERLHFSPAFIERFGLFNILVLAEIIVGVVTGLAEHHHLTMSVFAVGGLGLSIAFIMWWLYFDFISHRKPLGTQVAGSSWLYMHLFVSMSIVATGAAVRNVVEHTGEPLEAVVRWALVGAIAVYLLSLVPLMRVISVVNEAKTAYGRASIMVFIIALIITLLGFSKLATLPLLIIIVFLMLVPVVYAVVFWVRVLDAKDLYSHID